MKGIGALLLGSLLALGVCVIVLVVCAVSMSAGVIRTDALSQATAGACLTGCFFGGLCTCNRWNTKRLIGGNLTGIVVFALFMLTSLVGGSGEFGLQAFIELAACVVGGGLAGVVSAGRRKSRKKARK